MGPSLWSIANLPNTLGHNSRFVGSSNDSALIAQLGWPLIIPPPSFQNRPWGQNRENAVVWVKDPPFSCSSRINNCWFSYLWLGPNFSTKAILSQGLHLTPHEQSNRWCNSLPLGTHLWKRWQLRWWFFHSVRALQLFCLHSSEPNHSRNSYRFQHVDLCCKLMPLQAIPLPN